MSSRMKMSNYLKVTYIHFVIISNRFFFHSIEFLKHQGVEFGITLNVLIKKKVFHIDIKQKFFQNKKIWIEVHDWIAEQTLIFEFLFQKL